LRHNIGLKLLSLALAVGAWGYVRFAGNLTLTAQLERFTGSQERSSGAPMCAMVHEGRRLGAHGFWESALDHYLRPLTNCKP
jgi:hypothetical protein